MTITDADDPGTFEARYLAFLETITQLRPSLHRYCARMTGSVLDGEDVVQEALFQAYRKLDTFDESRPLTPWLFRIAHNRCIDVLRRRGVRESAEADAAMVEPVAPADPVGSELGRAVEHLVVLLPPKERASVLLKDVFDYSLEEIAELVDSTVGGVKAALHRGRARLARLSPRDPPARDANPETAELLQRYVERFNRRDWDGLRELISADARLSVADRYVGGLSDSPYFTRYQGWPFAWRVAAGEVDGVPVAIVYLQPEPGTWSAHAIIHLEFAGGRVRHVHDYLMCPWMIPAAASVVLPDLS